MMQAIKNHKQIIIFIIICLVIFFTANYFFGFLNVLPRSPEKSANAAPQNDQATSLGKTEVVEAVVVSINNTENNTSESAGLPFGGQNIPQEIQNITAKITSGNHAGQEVTIVNDYITLKVGDNFFATGVINPDGSETYAVADVNRLWIIFFFFLLFIAVLFMFGGMQGIRGLATLLGSLVLIIYVLIPGILHGYSPVLVSIGTASFIIILGSFITHGFNKTTLSAVAGMVATIILTGILASVAVSVARLQGYSSEETAYLNLSANGTINLVGLLLGGMLIGLLGVLYDAAISQAISVEELIRANPSMAKIILYQRAIRIGREHIGALVNTLAIAYVGVSLPLLLLLFSPGGSGYTFTGGFEAVKFLINSEMFSTEILRIIIGGIGVILAVPITTIITVLILTRAKTLPEKKSAHTHSL